MSRYKLSRLARIDLEEIWLDLARRATINVADRIIDDITGCFSMLARMPQAGRIRPELEVDLRCFPVDDYLIYYRKAKRAGILVSRVVHGRRDQLKALKSKARKLR